MSTDEHMERLEALRRQRPVNIVTGNRAMLASAKSLKHLAYSARQAGLNEEQRAALVRLFSEEMR